MKNLIRFTILTAASMLITGFALSRLAPRVHTAPPAQDEKEAASVSIRAAGRRFPHVNFADGTDLTAGEVKAQKATSQPTGLVAADFDGDGVADLVTADRNGELKLYRGNADSLYPNSPQAEANLADKSFNDQAFHPSEKSFGIAAAPDFLAAGDFNADGKKDILAAAKNDSALHFLAGDGAGNFATDSVLPIGGAIAAFATGEIGRADGQTDVAVAVSGKRGARILVYEHPESAFKHQPEVFALPAVPTDIVIGNLDDDYYNDIAVASGNQLTVIHGRGQAYPWDLIPEVGIKRPRAVVATRQLPFTIAALAAGRFSNQRGESLAILGGDGDVYHLESVRAERPSNSKLPAEARNRGAKNLSVPTGVEARNWALITEASMSQEEAEKLGVAFINRDEIKGGKLNEFLNKRMEEQKERFQKADKDELEKLKAEGLSLSREQKARAKAAYLKTLSAQPSPLTKWNLQTLVAGRRLSGAAATGSTQKMFRARVSDSNVDDLVLLDSTSNQIQIVSQQPATGDLPQRKGRRLRAEGGQRAEVVSLDVENGALAALPMHLNADALTDLVVLRAGSTAPSVVPTAVAQTFTVNTTSDGPSNCQQPGQPCTLRHAIQLANANPGADQINFSIFGCGPHTIQPLSELPAITQAVTIFGGSQPCSSPSSPRIEINGSQIAGQAADGLKVRASNCFITGLVITGFQGARDPDTGSLVGGNGIVLETPVGFARSRFNSLFNNFLGVAPDGTTDRGNEAAGLLIFDSDNNNISNNVISGNGGSGTNDGSGIAVTNGNNNTITANKIGTNAVGTAKLPNDGWGLFLTGSNNQVGGDDSNQGNTISGNGESFEEEGITKCRGGEGVAIFPLVSLDTGALLTNGNVLKGNRIGTNSAGTAPLGNCSTGIVTDPLTTTTIGSITQNGRNIISDNGYNAIHCGAYDYSHSPTEGGYCSITGNNIGTDITGTIAMSNDWRNGPSGATAPYSLVNVFNNLSLSNIGAPGGTTPGGACTGFCNLISGNGSELQGLAFGAIGRWGFGLVIISNNFVGTNQNGTAALPNALDGIYATDSDTFIGGYDTERNLNFGNLVSGNKGAGIDISWWSPFIESTFNVESNLVGTDTTGGVAIPNGSGDHSTNPAVYARAVTNWTINIGGVNPFSRNIISGNNASGIVTSGHGGQINIINNYVGLSKFNQPLGNAKHGIVAGGNGTIVGGTGAGEGNVISNNTLAGVAVMEVVVGDISNTVNNSIRGNSISGNGGLGIDLSSTSADGDGVTPNDCDDSDEGPNRRQNFPELLAPTFNQDGTVTVAGTLRSLPSRSYKIDFYSNTAADPTQHGEGEGYIGTQTVQMSGSGFVAFEFTSTVQVPDTRKITATATDPDGNTSEFSCYAGGCGDSTPGGSKASSKAALFAAQDLKCLTPIEVNITTDEPDLDGNQSNPNLRDGKCDVADTPGEQCSLRAAIQEANARAGLDLINFEIPDNGVQFIAPTTNPLPPITDRVNINGTTQPGYTNKPLIEIRGAAIHPVGLDIRAGNVSVSGLAVRDFTEANILLDGMNQGRGGNNISACYVGISADGETGGQAFVSQNGILIKDGSGNNIIGSADIFDIGRNVISNNVNGVSIRGVNSSENKVLNNDIGTNAAGTMFIPNEVGVLLSNGATSNHVGEPALGNRISGNELGIEISGGGARFNKIAANVISTNGNGIVLGGSSDNNTIGGSHHTIGGTQQDEANTIVGHNLEENSVGILIQEASSENTIAGNYIGLDQAGQANPNSIGILIQGVNNNVGFIPEGMTIRVVPNTISANTKAGIAIAVNEGSEHTAEGNSIQFNRIGTNAGGSSRVGQQETGILVGGGAVRNTIQKNTISGNTESGINLVSQSTQTTITQNLIGTNSAGNNVVPNLLGIWISDSSNNLINQNIVSGNEEIGILLGVKIHDASGSGTSVRGRTYHSRLAKLSPQVTATGFVQRNRIESNRVGLSSDETTALPNGRMGIAVGEKATLNFIGGTRAQRLGNTVASHTLGEEGYGIFVGTYDDNAALADLPGVNYLQGNTVGFTLAGGQIRQLPNNFGIVLLNTGGFNSVGAPSGNDPNAWNYSNEVCYSTSDGIGLYGPRTVVNSISNNYVGVTASHPEADAGNTGNGIYAETVGQNFIENNVIGNSGQNGIKITNTAPAQDSSQPSLLIKGNEIGIFFLSDQVYSAGNDGRGIHILNSSRVLVGTGSAPSDNSGTNYIAANGDDGILIEGQNSTENTINYSLIGYPEMPNGGDGIEVRNAPNTKIGQAGLRNEIVNNLGHGIFINGETANATVIGNTIGVILRGNQYQALGNGLSGIKLFNAHHCLIGTTESGSGNIIGGNYGSGVIVQGVNAHHNQIRNNFIGTDAAGANLGNAEYGVLFTEHAYLNMVGGPESDSGNKIAFNGYDEPGAPGIWATSSADCCNTIDPNSIYGNNGLGIDLGELGVTPNDPGDADTGPNNLQNYPAITSANVDANGDLLITYKVDSAPGNSSYGSDGLRVEFFLADACFEGQTFIGHDQYTVADYNNGSPGLKTVNLGPAAPHGYTQGAPLTASATDADGNTSEFTPNPSGGCVGLPSAGQVIINEFRLRGPQGALDEFIELYNNTDSPFTVATADGSAGWTLARLSSGDSTITPVFTIPTGTVIPARGYYLALNDSAGGYSLSALAAGDRTYSADIPDNSGLALFGTSLPANLTLNNRLDAVGFSSVANTLFREGPGLSPSGGVTTNGEYSFVRQVKATSGTGTGLPVDTDNNQADFAFVATNGAVFDDRQSELGAPGPQNLTSPIQRNRQIRPSLLDPMQGQAGANNRFRDRTPVTNGTIGTLSIRRTYTNLTGQNITRLRFRIIDITTLNSPGYTLCPNPNSCLQAEVRALSSTDIMVRRADGSEVQVRGTTIETPPAQDSGGGLNASLSVGSITLERPLLPNATVSVQFLLGVQQVGEFRILVNVEALPQ